ncbi:hypothetical protein O3M35_004343 [Rhynocoris fuscipes]|uniref:Uncharacterized protein n=1 Tax=Rhynocoris fuscipes TaxID=488301 RepID=A0AAW1CN07_9HEMI
MIVQFLFSNSSSSDEICWENIIALQEALHLRLDTFPLVYTILKITKSYKEAHKIIAEGRQLTKKFNKNLIVNYLV